MAKPVTERLDGALGWGVSAAYVASLWPAWRRFAAALADPERAQRDRLRALITANANTRFGRRHRFAEIDGVAAYRARVPVGDYDSHAPWIERVADGEASVLTAEPIRMLEISGGSTAANKLVPYTESLLAEFGAATNPWLYDLYSRRPALWGTRSYWAISPVARRQTHTRGGLRVGIEDDTEYFGPMRRWALRRMLAVPPSLARIRDVPTWRRETCTRLLATADLGLVSVWSPTFLTLLMEAIDADLDALLAALPAARAGEIRSALDTAGAVTGEALWPRLGLISCWVDGASKHFIAGLRRWFPRTPIQPKGLLATEGVVSVPLESMGGAAVLAAGSHFLEFVDLDQPEREPLLAHELRVGGSYSPLLTTGGGLYRYHLKDVVSCVGLHQRTPAIRFEGKLDSVVDLCGEKLNARHVEAALATASTLTGIRLAFAVLSPVRADRPGYRLYIETDADDATLARAVEIVEAELAESEHYDYCRRLGQLQPLEAVRVRRGMELYCDAMSRSGRRFGSVKPTNIDVHGVAQHAFADTPSALQVAS